MARAEEQGRGQARGRRASPPPRVLIADADSLARRHLCQMATGAGYHVVAAVGDRAAALRGARDAHPDLAIVDTLLDAGHGGDVVGELQGRGGEGAPLVVLTAPTYREALGGGHNADVAAYLIKPLRPETFGPTIEVALTRTVELRAARARVTALDEELRARGLIERAKGILMDTQGLSEAAAHRCLQRQSMETRRRMRDMAAAIVAGEQSGAGARPSASRPCEASPRP